MVIVAPPFTGEERGEAETTVDTNRKAGAIPSRNLTSACLACPDICTANWATAAELFQTGVVQRKMLVLVGGRGADWEAYCVPSASSAEKIHSYCVVRSSPPFANSSITVPPLAGPEESEIESTDE